MQGPSRTNTEACKAIVQTAERFEREQPTATSDTIRALVKQQLTGYPADLVDATLEPKRRAEVAALPYV